jgi:hypothetical protein
MEMILSASKQRPVAECCEHGNETLGSVKEIKSSFTGKHWSIKLLQSNYSADWFS